MIGFPKDKNKAKLLHGAKVAYKYEIMIVDVIQGNLFELRVLPERQGWKNASPAVLFYHAAMIAFLSGNRSALKALAADECFLAEDCLESKIARLLVALRICILDKSTNETLVSRTLNLVDTAPAAWRGEAYFLVGALAFDLEKFHEAVTAFPLSELELKRAGAFRKALKAKANKLACESWIDPKKNNFPEYFSLYREARRLKETIAAAYALNNVAHRYRKLGAFGGALRLTTRALALVRNEMGTQPHYFLLINLCDLLIQCGRLDEAERHIDYCGSSPFVETKAAVAILRDKLAGKILESDNSFPTSLTPCWRERIEVSINSGDRPRLSPLEDALLQFLAARPRKKTEIRTFLYGDRIDPESGDVRVKRVLERIRSKHPSLVVYADGAYQLFIAA